VGVVSSVQSVQVHHLAHIMASDRSHVPDGARLSTQALATLVPAYVCDVDRLDQSVLLPHGLDDHRHRFDCYHFICIFMSLPSASKQLLSSTCSSCCFMSLMCVILFLSYLRGIC